MVSGYLLKCFSVQFFFKTGCYPWLTILIDSTIEPIARERRVHAFTKAISVKVNSTESPAILTHFVNSIFYAKNCYTTCI